MATSSGAAAAKASEYDKQRAKAEAYLKERQIPELLAHLLELVAYAQPADPRQYMLDAVKKLQAKKPECLFGDDELTTMFEMIDVTKQKSITVQQLKNACANLNAGAPLDEKTLPAEVRASGKVDVDLFKQLIGERLRTKNVW
jgi:hypothetical protein